MVVNFFSSGVFNEIIRSFKRINAYSCKMADWEKSFKESNAVNSVLVSQVLKYIVKDQYNEM